MLFSRLTLLFFVFLGVLTPQNASSNLWDAIDAFERGDDQEARTLLRPYAHGSPIAQPYCVDLNLTREKDYENLKGYTCDETARGWYEASLKARNIRRLAEELGATVKPVSSEREKKRILHLLQLKKDQQKKAVDELNNLDHPTAKHTLARLLEEKVLNWGETGKTLIPNLYKMSLTNYTTHDFRTVSHLHPNAKLKIGDLEFIQHAGRLQEAESIGHYLYNLGVENPSAQETCRKMAAYHGDLNAQLEMMAGHSQGIEEVFYWAVKIIEHPIEHFSDPSIYYTYLAQVAEFFQNGEGCQQNPKKAFSYSQRSVANGDPEQQHVSATCSYNHGHRLLNGVGIKPNPQEAEIYFKRAVEKEGDRDMKFLYALCLLENNKTEESQPLFKELALAGHCPSLQNFVATCTDPTDYVELLPICFELSKTDIDALKLMAIMLSNFPPEYSEPYGQELFDRLKGLDNDTDPERAIWLTQRGAFLQWLPNIRSDENVRDIYKRASDIGNADADYSLAQCFEKGIGGEPDSEHALFYYRKAIEGGLCLAYNPAGVLHEST